jgi:hypothetical protein
MKWTNIRLELARSSEFPEGSASRAYLLRLPIKDDGKIDEIALRDLPGRATARRFWPNEADLSGHVIRTDRGLALCYDRHAACGDTLFPLEGDQLCPGGYVTLTEPDGRRLPFRVASIQQVRQFPLRDQPVTANVR